MATTISLVLTVYNRERYLQATIESILAQSYQNFELLIWDDGSTDRSMEIARHYAAHDSRIRLVEAVHQGSAGSLKSAIAQTTGVYFGCVDSDDLLAIHALEETTAILNTHPEVGMVYTDHVEIDASDRVLGLGKRCQIPYSKQQLLVDFMTFHFRLMRRSVYEQIGGVDLSFTCAHDYDLCLRLAEITNIYHIQRPLYAYRIHLESISQQKRFEQITCAQRAVTSALKRQGLNNQYEIDIEIISRFSLRPKFCA